MAKYISSHSPETLISGVCSRIGLTSRSRLPCSGIQQPAAPASYAQPANAGCASFPPTSSKCSRSLADALFTSLCQCVRHTSVTQDIALSKTYLHGRSFLTQSWSRAWEPCLQATATWVFTQQQPQKRLRRTHDCVQSSPAHWFSILCFSASEQTDYWASTPDFLWIPVASE